MQMQDEERGQGLNGYDLLKTFAVITMLVDHVGYYFYPDELWLRAVGRLSFPIWFFLIGYARSRDLSPKLLGGAALLICVNLVLGLQTLPLNALCTIILLRLILDLVARIVEDNSRIVWLMTIGLTVFIVPAGEVTEYGTLSVMFALLGYFVRHEKVLPFYQRLGYAAMIAAIYVVYQMINFDFALWYSVPLGLSMAFLVWRLFRFQGREWPERQTALPQFVIQPLKFCGTWSLEIYVGHLILFKLMTLALL